MVYLNEVSPGFIFFCCSGATGAFYQFAMFNSIKSIINRLADWLEARQSGLTLFMVGACLFYVDLLTPRTDITELNIMMLGLVKYAWIFCIGMGTFMLVRKEMQESSQAKLKEESKPVISPAATSSTAE